MMEVIKRDGILETFKESKVINAVAKAVGSVMKDEGEIKRISSEVGNNVVRKIMDGYHVKSLHIEIIQDMIEVELMQSGYPDIAKSYILYREDRRNLRSVKTVLGLKDDIKLTLNSLEILKSRYLLKDERQNVIETPGQLFRRVAGFISSAEDNYDSGISRDEAEEKFYKMMSNLEFLPNSPTLMNSGLPNHQLSACFVLPVQDSIDSIFLTLHAMAKIHQTGGGTGFNFSNLRPDNDIVKSTNGTSSGPLSFISIYDQTTEIMLKGGKRRGANMGILRCDHPDIMEFIEAKLKTDRFKNFNFSVGITDQFMDDVYSNRDFSLINPRTGLAVRTVLAKDLFNLIVSSAWACGDPGLIFLDEINRKNPTPGAGMIEATNPCGELPLLPYESCNLGSINLSRMVTDGKVNFELLKDTIKWSVRFLDNVIDVNGYPLPEVKAITQANRKIGLGVMGFADMLIRCGISYTSNEAVLFSERIMQFVREEALKASSGLAEERGVFPNFEKSVYAKSGLKLRNATVNTIAPTGTISIIADCSSGIEPLFGISFVRNIMSGRKFLEVNGLFEEEARRSGFFNDDVMSRISVANSLKDMEVIPDEIKRIFVTAFDVAPEQHLKIQAAFQKYTDNSVSKTINLPSTATMSDVEKIYILAHKSGCKGITVYRYGSRENQVLTFQETGKSEKNSNFIIQADSEFSGGCVSGKCSF
jgi:ribonucleoside-diphosphate reductase alpha chain